MFGESAKSGTTSRSGIIAPRVSAQNENAAGRRTYASHGTTAWNGVRGTPPRTAAPPKGFGLGPPEQRHEERLLRVQAVLRLIPHDGLRPVRDLVRDLESAVRGGAVHDHRVVLRLVHELLVHLVRLEDPLPFRLLLLHAHGDPDVRVHDVRALHR